MKNYRSNRPLADAERSNVQASAYNVSSRTGEIGDATEPRLTPNLLPTHSMARSARQKAVLDMQQTRGNAAVRRMLSRSRGEEHGSTVQRQSTPGSGQGQQSGQQGGSSSTDGVHIQISPDLISAVLGYSG